MTQHPTPPRAKLATPRPQTPPPPPERLSGRALAKERLLDAVGVDPIRTRRPQPKAVALGPAARPAPIAQPSARAGESFALERPLPGLAERLESQVHQRSVAELPSAEPAEHRGHDAPGREPAPLASPAVRGLGGAKADFRPRARASAPKAPFKGRRAAKAPGAMSRARAGFAGLMALWGEEVDRHAVAPLRTLWSAKGELAAALLPIFAPLLMACLLAQHPSIEAAFLSGDRVARLGGMCFLYVACAFAWVFAWMIAGRIWRAITGAAPAERRAQRRD